MTAGNWMTIEVRGCDLCDEAPQQYTPADAYGRQRFGIEGFEVCECDKCGTVACHSCLSDHYCCEAIAEAEALSRKNGQLF